MIFFFCGATRHGSHFQRYIVQESLEQPGIICRIAGNRIFHDHRMSEGSALLAELSIDRTRETRNDPGGRFFRRGVCGEHRSFDFGDEVRSDFSRLAAMSKARLQALVAVGRMLNKPCRVLHRVRRKLVARG